LTKCRSTTLCADTFPELNYFCGKTQTFRLSFMTKCDRKFNFSVLEVEVDPVREACVHLHVVLVVIYIKRYVSHTY